MKAIQPFQLLDVVSGRIIPSPTIIIQDDKILDVLNGNPPLNIPTFYFPNLTLLPGLIDSHTHITYHYDSHGRFGWENPTSDLLFQYGLDNAKHTLHAGFTTIRDVGAMDNVDFRLKRILNDNPILGPRMLISGEPIFQPDDALQQVQDRTNSGVDIIKIFNDGQFRTDQIRRIVNSTYLPVSAHSFYPSEIIDSSNGGCVSIEHGSFLNYEAAQVMVQNGTSLIPTLSMPIHYLENKNRFKFSPNNWEHFNKTAANQFNAVRIAKQVGVNIVFGTDAVAGAHGNNAREFFLLQKAGLTSLEAIQTATINPARVLKRYDLGQIRPGFKADIIGIVGNPLDDLRYLSPNNIKFVMRDGEIVKSNYRS